jgi:pyruvate,water dikinase
LARHFPGLELHRQYLRLWDVLARMGQQTLKAQLPSKNQYFIFGEEMRRLFPGLPDKAIPQMLQGFEALAFRPVEELQKLACAALELAVADALLGHDGWEETARALAESEGGRKWLVRFDEARRPWFEMSGATGWQKQSLAWNDDLNVPLARIRSYVAALRRGEDISRPRAAVLAERDRVTQEYLERLRDPAARQTFERLLALTRALAPASENHNFYHTGRFHSLYNRKIRSLGRVLVAHGVLEDPEEIFLLNRQELDGTVWDVYQSWSRSKEPAGKYYWPARLARRREILARLADWAPPPALGRVPKQLRSPFAIVHFGLTSEALQAWLEAARGEEGESLRLTGFPGGPGSVEGIARVCRTTGDLCRLQPGEILVAPTTGPAWAPAFQALGGCVTDSGGMFCHAAIVAREYGLPAVIGTGYGTARIRSGDRIRVDGDLGVVEVLERKE